MSRMMKCTTDVPECQNQTSVLNTMQCNGFTNKSIVYRYERCEIDSLAQANHNNQFECLCITDPLTECRADLLNDKCTAIFMAMSSVLATIVLLGIIFNLMVCFVYCCRRSTRKRLPNILLVNQAIADLVNCVCYALPNTILQFIFTIYKTIHPVKIFHKEYRHSLAIVCEVMAFVSISSSVMIYLVIASERWIAIVKPLWYHARLRKRHLWRAVMTTWLISFTASVLVLFVNETFTYAFYFRAMQGTMVLLIMIITLLFALTFYKALKEIRRRRKLKKNFNKTRKEFRLTKVFLMMYSLFLVTFIPLAVLNPNEKNPRRRIKFLFFTLTAMINPLLTLTLKRDFRLQSRGNSLPSIKSKSVWFSMDRFNGTIKSFRIPKRKDAVSKM